MLLVSVAIGVLVAGGVTAGLVFGLGTYIFAFMCLILYDSGGSKPPSGNPLEDPGTGGEKINS